MELEKITLEVSGKDALDATKAVEELPQITNSSRRESVTLRLTCPGIRTIGEDGRARKTFFLNPYLEEGTIVIGHVQNLVLHGKEGAYGRIEFNTENYHFVIPYKEDPQD